MSRKLFTDEQAEYITSIENKSIDAIMIMVKKKYPNISVTNEQLKRKIVATNHHKIKANKIDDDLMKITKEIYQENSTKLIFQEMANIYCEKTGLKITSAGFRFRVDRMGLRKKDTEIWFVKNKQEELKITDKKENERRKKNEQKLLTDYMKSLEIDRRNIIKPRKKEIASNVVCFLVNGKTYEGNLDKKSNDIYQKLMGRW